jgi:hypothetical protein
MIESIKGVNTTQKPAGVNMRKGAQMIEVTQRIAKIVVIRCVGSTRI